MPTSATGTWRSSPRGAGPPPRGFTLVEVLVVMLIMAVLASLATLSLGGRRDPVREEAERLAALLDLVRQEAVLQGRELAVEVEDAGYRFLALDGGQWVPLAGDRLLRERRLPSAVLVVGLEVEGREAMPAGPGEVLGRIFFLPSGEATPFRLRLGPAAHRGREVLIRGDRRGRLALEWEGEGRLATEAAGGAPGALAGGAPGRG